MCRWYFIPLMGPQFGESNGQVNIVVCTILGKKTKKMTLQFSVTLR